MERTTVEHHDQGICGFAVDVLKLEFDSAAGSTTRELDVFLSARGCGVPSLPLAAPQPAIASRINPQIETSLCMRPA
jgi:hypothetical protein